MNSVAWRLDLLQENADQLEGLWSRRLHAERSPELDVDGLNGLDRQIVAHADALALAGAQAGPILDGLFAARNLAAAAAAAFVIGWGDAPAMVPRLLEAFAAARQRERRGMVAALELRAGRVLLDALATSSWAAPSCPDVEARAGVIAICAAHGDRPSGVEALDMVSADRDERRLQPQAGQALGLLDGFMDRIDRLVDVVDEALPESR